MAYKQKNNPFAVTSCGRRRSYMTTGNPAPFKKKEKEKFKAHDMYDKQHADTLAKHLKLKEKGYDHSPYKKKNAEGKEQGIDGKACWDGYRFAGTEDGSDKCVPMKMMEDDSPLDKKKRKRKKSGKIRKTTKGKSRNFRTTKEGAGMTAAGVRKYKAKNPGSKLKTAVTGKVKKGSKAAGRRKSFCARSKGWKGERGRAARRRWKC